MSAPLQSWKEIANHLGVNVRTAQKWERERQLPVKRGPGGRVSADQAALTAWVNAQGTGEQCTYRWPVGNGIMAEVRFGGGRLTSANVELLRQYLELVKTALQP